MEVTIISRETISPSSPTPPHLKTFELSLLDQLSPLIYIPLVFFYPKNKNPIEAIAALKTSLSKALSCFFLLAGRIVEKSIVCNDEGAIFTQASVSCNMSEMLTEPDNHVLMKLLPCPVVCSGSTVVLEELAQVVVQANIFNCGGIAISLCLLHKLIDGVTFSCFLRSWASISKGTSNFQHCSSPNMISSNYIAFSSLFPQTNLLPFHQPITHGATPSSSMPDRPENIISESSVAFSPSAPADREHSLRRFVFREKSIRELKEKSKSSEVPNPTTVETLTGFVWKHVMEDAATTTSSSSTSTLSHVVNLRKRMEPPFGEVCVGNMVWGTVAHCTSTQEMKLSELVGILRGSLSKINSDYIKGLMGNGDDEGARGAMKLVGEVMMNGGDSSYYFCTSWRNMDLNEVDFGWGKPVWIGIAGDFKQLKTNIIVFLDTISLDGVEVWMLLHENQIQRLLQNSQFLEFALLNPSADLDFQGCLDRDLKNI